jgi:hypothetical protein
MRMKSSTTQRSAGYVSSFSPPIPYPNQSICSSTTSTVSGLPRNLSLMPGAPPDATLKATLVPPGTHSTTRSSIMALQIHLSSSTPFLPTSSSPGTVLAIIDLAAREISTIIMTLTIGCSIGPLVETSFHRLWTHSLIMTFPCLVHSVDRICSRPLPLAHSRPFPLAAKVPGGLVKVL